MMILTKYIACICEGAAEKVIMELLLDANMLTFTQDDLLDGELIRCRSAKNFEEQYLRKGFAEKNHRSSNSRFTQRAIQTDLHQSVGAPLCLLHSLKQQKRCLQECGIRSV